MDGTARDVGVHRPIVLRDDPRYLQACRGLTQLGFDAARLPSGGHDVIYADPNWMFSNWSSKGALRGAARHYPCMSTPLLASLPVAGLAAADAWLFMWACWPLMPDALKVIEAWGFTFKGLAWEWWKVNPKTGKASFGGGYGTRKNCEPCLLATRGAPKRQSASERDFIETGDVLQAQRREHSRKPDEAYGAIERLTAPRHPLELFSRASRAGWTMWGNEVGLFEGGGAA